MNVLYKNVLGNLQVDASHVNVLYENGDTEELTTSEVLRDSLLSLGWVQPDYPSCPSSEVASAAGEASGVAWQG